MAVSTQLRLKSACTFSKLSHHDQQTEALSRRSSNEASPEDVQSNKEPVFALLRNDEIEDQKVEATVEQVVDTSRLSYMMLTLVTTE